MYHTFEVLVLLTSTVRVQPSRQSTVLSFSYYTALILEILILLYQEVGRHDLSQLQTAPRQRGGPVAALTISVAHTAAYHANGRIIRAALESHSCRAYYHI